MSVINICKSVSCPFYGEGKHYGCQQYVFSCGCHLRCIQKFQSTEYILFIQNFEIIDLKALKSENDRFFLEDSTYKDTLEFQDSHPDWFEPDSFVVKKIAS